MSEIILPRFRYIEDIKRFLDKMNTDLKQNESLLDQRQQLLASQLDKVDPNLIKDIPVFNLSPAERKEQIELIKKLRSKIEPALARVVVPNMKKLASQYKMAEELYAQLRAVDQCETQLNMVFQSKRGDQFEETNAQIGAVRARIEDQMKRCFKFLSDVAHKHTPLEFKSYAVMIADMVNEHVIFKDSESFMYVSVTPEGDLAFTSYLMLRDVANDEGRVAPHLYISVQWVLGPTPRVVVDLNQEYEVPNNLLGSGELVTSVGDAVKCIAEMLTLENFSSALGVVPLALQMKVDPTSLTTDVVSYRDLVSKVIVDENTSSVSFCLRKAADVPEVLTEIGAQIYKELKAALRHKGVRLTMKQATVGSSKILIFTIVRVADGDELTHYDLEFMRDKFGLSSVQLRKIATILRSI